MTTESNAETMADRIMLVGDPDRIEVGRKLFDTIELETRRREFRCITGTVHGTRMSLLSTGISPEQSATLTTIAPTR